VLDVIVVGAGPAGSIAALTLAREGARVLIVDRETFPRDKLCGDTVNPGALDLLESIDLTGGPLASGRPLAGMLLSGPRVSVRALYGSGIVGRAVTRRDLDLWLLEHAIRAGARFEAGVIAREPLIAELGGRRVVRGLALASRGHRERISRMPANLVIAADGSRSSLARGLGLLGTPDRPRRWAFGTYATGVQGTSEVGEMHIRRGAYLGIAPLTDTVVNVCVVTGPRPEGRGALDVMRRVINQDPRLAARFETARFLGRPRVLGPLASDAIAPGVEGLLLAGDAAGFIDPMTGDGLHLAIRGALLAAREALRTLETADFRLSVRRLAEARAQALGAKLRFNRGVRFITGSPAAIGLASCGAAIAPGVMRRLVRYAGDVPNRPNATGPGSQVPGSGLQAAS
jgi:flavin-dependent dehydrogenase